MKCNSCFFGRKPWKRRCAVGMLLLSLVLFSGIHAGASPAAGDTGLLDLDADNGGITLPDGFRAVVVANNLGRARHLTVNDNGDIYVRLRMPRGGGIVALRDLDGDGRADVAKPFGSTGGTGIQVYGGYLYASHVTGVVRYKLKKGELLPEPEPQIVVTGFPDQKGHDAKPIAFDAKGGLYVNVGAPSNACQKSDRTRGSPGMDPCPLLERHGGIWRFSAEKANQTQMEDGERYATGMRHNVAMAWNPIAGELYTVMHGRDQLNDLWPERFTVEQNAELPAEELLLVQPGDNFGWPYCYYDPIRKKKTLAPEYGGDGNDIGRCNAYKDPIMAFPAHWAPNGLLFYTGSQFPERYRGGAFIAFHGSWNRAPLQQKGYKVVFVPFDGKLPSGPREVFADGFAGREVIENPTQARFRPMGLAQGPDGSLYISDSQQGRIWRVVYTGKKGM